MIGSWGRFAQLPSPTPAPMPPSPWLDVLPDFRSGDLIEPFQGNIAPEVYAADNPVPFIPLTTRGFPFSMQPPGAANQEVEDWRDPDLVGGVSDVAQSKALFEEAIEAKIARAKPAGVGAYTRAPSGDFTPVGASSESLQVAAAKVLGQQGIDPRFATIVPTRQMTGPESKTAGGFYMGFQPSAFDESGKQVSAIAGGGSGFVALPQPTFGSLFGKNDWQQTVVMHEMSHAFEDLLNESERDELARLMEKNPTLLASLGYSDAEYHPGALTRYFDQWSSGISIPHRNEGLTEGRVTEAAFAGQENRTRLSGQIPADLINFINRMMPQILERSQAAAARSQPPDFK